jgi:hypothetical protein
MENQTITIENLSLEEIKSLLFMLMECENKKWHEATESKETNELLHIIIAEIACSVEKKLKNIITKKRKKKYSVKLKHTEVCCFISVFYEIKTFFQPFEQNIITTICHQYDHWEKNKIDFLTQDYLLNSNQIV